MTQQGAQEDMFMISGLLLHTNCELIYRPIHDTLRAPKLSSYFRPVYTNPSVPSNPHDQFRQTVETTSSQRQIEHFMTSNSKNLK